MNNEPDNHADTNPDTLPHEQQTSPPADVTPPVQKRWSSKKALLITLSAVVIVLLGGYYAWTVMTPKKTTRDYGTAQKIPQFYLVSDAKSVRTFDPVTKRLSSEAIGAGEKEMFSGRSAYANQFLQMTPDGATTAYMTDEYNYDSPYTGDGVRGPTGHLLYSLKYGSDAKQVMDGAKVSDWILSADGSMIYYLAQSESGSSLDFHVRSLADDKDILVEKDIFSDSVGQKETPMLLADDGSVRMYITYDNGIREYRYKDTFVTSNRWTTAQCKGCKIAFGSPLSPDGNSLVLTGIEQTGQASLNILDLKSGTIKQVKRTDKMSEQFNTIYWSPDGASIVYSVKPYGSAADQKVGFLNRFEIYTLKTGAFTTGFSDPSPGISAPDYAQHTVGVLGWSPDGSVIAFYNEGKVKMYTVVNRQITDTGLEYEQWKDPSLASGWYTIWHIAETTK